MPSKFEPKINKTPAEASTGRAALTGGGHGGRYIPAAAGPKGYARSAVKASPRGQSCLNFGNLAEKDI